MRRWVEGGGRRDPGRQTRSVVGGGCRELNLATDDEWGADECEAGVWEKGRSASEEQSFEREVDKEKGCIQIWEMTAMVLVESGF